MTRTTGRSNRRALGLVIATYGAVCYLDGPYCRRHGREIDLTLRWPHPGSASIEHYGLPVSRGGGNELENLRPAHLGCNASKGDGTRATTPRRAAETGPRFSVPEAGKPRSPFPSPPERPKKTAERAEKSEVSNEH